MNASTLYVRGLWLLLLGAVLTSSCAEDAVRASTAYLASGDDYFAHEKYEKAIIEYRNATRTQPRSADAHAKLAEAYVRVNDRARALREYIVTADLLPDSSEAQLKAGGLLLLANRFEDAKARADAVLEKERTNVHAQILRGNALAGLKDIDTALAQIEEAIGIDPSESLAYQSLGAVQLAAGDSERAEAAFRKAAQLAPLVAQPRLALAVFYLSRQRIADAEIALQDALRADALHPGANRMLALVYLASNRAPGAERHLKAVADVTKTVAARLALADYYSLMRRAPDAIAILESIPASDSEAFAAAQARLAAIEYAQGRATDSKNRLSRVLSRHPNHAGALLLNAKFLLWAKRLDEAVASAAAATAAEPRSAAAQFILAKVYLAQNRLDEAAKAFGEVVRLNPRAASAHIELARLQLANGIIEASVQSLRNALTIQPGNPEARLLLARSLIARNELAAANNELSTLLSRYPQVAAVHSQLGGLFLAKNDRRAARRSYDKALELDPRSLDALLGVLRVQFIEKNTTELTATLEARLAERPNHVGLLLLAASFYTAMGNSDHAERLSRHAVEIAPANQQAHAMLAAVLFAQQKLDAAKAEFEWIATHGTDQSAKVASETMLGLILEAQYKLDEATKQYERIVATAPRAALAANNLARLYAEGRGSLNVALTLAQSAVRQQPDQPKFNDTLGWVYLKKGSLARAIDAFQRSVDKAPADPVYQYHLGVAHAKNDDGTRAKQCLEKALALNPNFTGSDEARRLLRTITE